MVTAPRAAPCDLPLDPAVLERVDPLSQAFANAEPFRHVVIDNFLDDAFARGLAYEFPGFDLGDSKDEHGKPGDKATVERIRRLGPAFARLDEIVRSPRFLQLVSRVTGIDDLLYDPWYFGGGTHANRHGAKLDRHVDFSFHPIERWQRRLNLIIYLNEEWEPGWGGNLDLFRDARLDAGPAHSIAPCFNRCVVFETNDRSWHGFDRICLPETQQHRVRRSIALYFYTAAEEPTGQERQPHSTIYVEERLPSHLTAGHVLRNEDIDRLNGLLADRDGRIRMQYDEIARLMALIRAYEKGPVGIATYALRKLAARIRRF